MKSFAVKLTAAYNDYYNACNRRERLKKESLNAFEAANLAADMFRSTVREVADELVKAADQIEELKEQHSVMVATLKDAKDHLNRPADRVDFAGLLSGIDAALMMLAEAEARKAKNS